MWRKKNGPSRVLTRKSILHLGAIVHVTSRLVASNTLEHLPLARLVQSITKRVTALNTRRSRPWKNDVIQYCVSTKKLPVSTFTSRGCVANGSRHHGRKNYNSSPDDREGVRVERNASSGALPLPRKSHHTSGITSSDFVHKTRQHANTTRDSLALSSSTTNQPGRRCEPVTICMPRTTDVTLVHRASWWKLKTHRKVKRKKYIYEGEETTPENKRSDSARCTRVTRLWWWKERTQRVAKLNCSRENKYRQRIELLSKASNTPSTRWTAQIFSARQQKVGRKENILRNPLSLCRDIEDK